MLKSTGWLGVMIACLTFCRPLCAQTKLIGFAESLVAHHSDCDAISDPRCAGCDASDRILSRLQEPKLPKLGGWIAGGLTVNADGNRSGDGNAPYGYNNVSDGAVLNQLWL